MEDNKLNQANDFLTQAKSIGDAVVSLAGAVGIGGLKFDIIRAENVNMSANITDHYTEDNRPICDDIVIRPVVLTLRGEVGDIVDTVADKEGFLDKATRKISTCLSYVPAITKGANLISGVLKNPRDAFGSLSGAIGTGMNVFDVFNSINIPNTPQEKAFLYFESLIKAKQRLTVKTAWRTFPSMAIQSIQAVQQDTKDFSTFIIVLKEVRTTKTEVLKKVSSGATSVQSAEPSNLGTVGKEKI